MLYTVHYDGINLESDDVTDDFIDAYYQKYPFQKTCDIFDTESGDIVKGYEEALEASDHRLSISYVEVYVDKQWKNIHELLEE